MLAVKGVFVVALILSSVVNSARIFGIFPIPSKSHQNVYDSLMVELANRGHEVVMITAFPMAEAPANLTQIDVSFSASEIKSRMKYASFSGKKPADFGKVFLNETLNIFEMQLQMPQIKKILEDKSEKFDLMFITFFNMAHAFKHRFPETPVITFTTLAADFQSVGAPEHPVLYPEHFHEHWFDLTLWQKIENIYDSWIWKRMILNCDEYTTERLKKYFGDDLPSVTTLKENTDLLFSGYNPLLASVRPTVPTLIQTDRLHLKQKKPLPKDLQDFLDKSTNGFIYMSLGSNVQSKDLSGESLRAISEAFAELPYNVLWKFELDSLPGLPDNVIIKKWFPQQDLMGHKNMKAFIFQGGQQSWEESIRDSVPLVCIPFAGDQKTTAQKIERRGIGVRVDFATMTKDVLKGAIMEVTTNPKYKKNAIKLMKLVFDEPQTPLERAVWWTEYVIRHKGAQHLRSPALDTSYFEFFMLDVIGVLLAGFVLALLFLSLVIKFLINFFKSKSSKVKIN